MRTKSATNTPRADPDWCEYPLRFAPLQMPEDILRHQFEEAKRHLGRLVEEAARGRVARDAPDRGGRWRKEKLRLLRRMLGLPRHRAWATWLVAPPTPLTEEGGVAASRVSWRCRPNLTVDALLLEPVGREPARDVILVPHPEVTPEGLCGLAGPGSPHRPVALELARAGDRVLSPHILRRDRLGDLPLDDRQRIFRLAWLVGRHLLGNEVRVVVSCLDYLRRNPSAPPRDVWVTGEGLAGFLALLTATLDRRARGVSVIGDGACDRDPERLPVDADLWQFDRHFAPADLVALVAPRPVLFGEPEGQAHSGPPFSFACGPREIAARQRREVRELESHYFHLLSRAPKRRRKRWPSVRSSLEAYEASLIGKREAYLDLIGRPPAPDAPLEPRTALLREGPTFRAYHTTIGVYEGVHAYGILVVPKGIGPDERRPAVLCQHGFHGRPEFALGLVDDDECFYHRFGLRLAERGYVVFAPYIIVPDAEHRNVLVRLGRRIGVTPVGLEARKLGRIIDFLETLPFVDAARLGFYGLSYGGYTALWVGPVEPRLKVIVCSGHFNGWQEKVTRYWPEMHTCYMWHPDEDFYNWDILNRFSHFDLATLICPRPFLVETGLRDGVTPPEWVQPEWQKVRRLYDRLGIPERAEQHVFDGEHEVNASRSLPFLDRWLS